MSIQSQNGSFRRRQAFQNFFGRTLIMIPSFHLVYFRPEFFYFLHWTTYYTNVLFDSLLLQEPLGRRVIRVAASSREYMQALRSLLVTSHWHAFTLLYVGPEAALGLADLKLLSKPPLSATVHRLSPHKHQYTKWVLTRLPIPFAKNWWMLSFRTWNTVVRYNGAFSVNVMHAWFLFIHITFITIFN